MAPVAYGMLVTIAGVIVLAILVGAAGGAVNGRLKGDLSLGAIVVVGAYAVAVRVLASSWKLGVFGMLPLMLTFVVGSVTGTVLATRYGLRQVLAIPAALCSALLAGLLYMMLIKLRWLALTELGTAWVALATLCFLLLLSLQKRLRERPRRPRSMAR